MEAITYILFSTIVVIITYFIKNYFIEQIDKKILKVRLNGPKGYPIIGNAYMFKGSVGDISKKIIKENKKFNSPWRLYIGPKLFIFLDDPKYIKAVFQSSRAMEKSIVYTFLNPVLGNGLLTAPAIRGQNNRKKLRHMFNKKTIGNYSSKIVTSSLSLLEILDSFNGEEVDVSRLLFICTLNIICDALFGVDFNFQKDPELKIDEHVVSLMDSVMERTLKLWLYPDVIYYNTSTGKKFKRSLSSINNFTQKIIEKGKESMSDNEFENGTPRFGNTGENKESFLNMLFDLSKDLEEGSEKYIRDEIHTFIAAGSETTAITMSFALLMLATYPEIQEKVYEELFQMYGSKDPQDFPIIYEDIKYMRYLELVIKETLRLFSPAPVVGRETSDDIKVNDDLIIPKNSSVYCLIIELHRNAKYWKEPLQFDPDRFLSSNYNPDNFIPFSIGRRDCIGQHLAMLEMKIVLANILRKFIVKVDHPRKIEDIDVVMSITLRPSEPILLRLIRR